MAREEMSEQQAMSAERLAEIRVAVAQGPLRDGDMMRELLAEVERQRAALAAAEAREAALVAYIEGMAAFSPAARIEDIQRKIIEARALLAAGEQAQGEA